MKNMFKYDPQSYQDAPERSYKFGWFIFKFHNKG